MPDPRPSIDALTDAVIASYQADDRTRHIDAGALPRRADAIALLELLRDVFFPGFFSPDLLTSDNVRDHIANQLASVRSLMESLITDALIYADNRSCEPRPADAPTPADITDAFLAAIPDLRAALTLDVQAAYDGDPAARDTDETVFCYPGIDAVFTHRVAHHLHAAGVPLLPRILSEYVHNETGIDIHPGATIGRRFFIDHGTGVVIGETCHIGDNVKLYQSVTLGALSIPHDQGLRGTRRHPTLEDDVIVYANATILGGETVIGQGSVIGGGVFLTKSVPPNHFVTLKAQDLKYRSVESHNRIGLE